MISHYSTPLTRDELRNYFLSGCKQESELALGAEWEKIGVYRDTGEAIRYTGSRGVRSIFEALIRQRGWQAVLSSEGLPIALKKGAASITLEPGGQIELSGQKAFHIADNARELFSHLQEIKLVSDPLGIVWLGIGAQPFSIAEDIEWVPKERYTVMRKQLARKGPRTYSMMKETASVQFSLDYTSEKDAIEKLRLAMALSPVLTALLANSPIEKGLRTDFYSRRANIWRHTAPERTGIPWKIFEASFTFDDYVRYALSVPLLFLQRGGQWHSPEDLTFEDFLLRGWKDLSATWEDWDLHLTSIFTEARMKKYIELRSMDCPSAALGLAAAAFIKGLFYNSASRQTAWEIVGSWPLHERQRLMEEVPRKALQTKIGNSDLLEIGQALYKTSRQGLAADEKPYLEPLGELLTFGICPAQRLLNCIGKSTEKTDILRQIIRCCEI